jgi:hypothetical protein
MRLQQLIDRMIDQAETTDPEGSYSILVGVRPVTEKNWPAGTGVYRTCPIVQTKLVPNSLVVLAPCPDNVRRADLIEYHGRILTGAVTRHRVRRATSADLAL